MKRLKKNWRLLAGFIIIISCALSVYFIVALNATPEYVQAFAPSYELTDMTPNISPMTVIEPDKEPEKNDDAYEPLEEKPSDGEPVYEPAEEIVLSLYQYNPESIRLHLHELDTLLSRFGNGLSVYFENLETGFVYRYNTARRYFGASISKAPFALYIYQKAERGEIDLDETLTFTYADANWGSGIIAHHYPFGTEFTIRELLRLNISESDNVATLMLRRHFGIAGFRNFITELGANPNNIGDNIMNAMLTPNDAGIFAREIFRYIESDGKYSAEFKLALMNNRFPFIFSGYHVASKTGWTAPSAWHDMAIVYAPSPFVLVIFSSREGWTEQDFQDFSDISKLFHQFNHTWFVSP